MMSAELNVKPKRLVGSARVSFIALPCAGTNNAKIDKIGSARQKEEVHPYTLLADLCPSD